MYIVGKVLKPKGLKGELKVEIITSFPEHFQELKKISVKDGLDWKNYPLVSVRLSDRFAFLKLQGIDSIESAETLRNQFLYIAEEDLNTLADDEYYLHDLVGMRVFDEHENLLGEIIDVESYAANDVYVLKDLQGEEHLLPAIKEVILSVDIARSKMIICKIEGLME